MKYTKELAFSHINNPFDATNYHEYLFWRAYQLHQGAVDRELENLTEELLKSVGCGYERLRFTPTNGFIGQFVRRYLVEQGFGYEIRPIDEGGNMEAGYTLFIRVI